MLERLQPAAENRGGVCGREGNTRCEAGDQPSVNASAFKLRFSEGLNSTNPRWYPRAALKAEDAETQADRSVTAVSQTLAAGLSINREVTWHP